MGPIFHNFLGSGIIFWMEEGARKKRMEKKNTQLLTKFLQFFLLLAQIIYQKTIEIYEFNRLLAIFYNSTHLIQSLTPLHIAHVFYTTYIAGSCRATLLRSMLHRFSRHRLLLLNGIRRRFAPRICASAKM